MNGSGLYFNLVTKTILDVSSGVFKYDPGTHTFDLVKPFSKQERLILACMLSHNGLFVTEDTLLTKAWAGRAVSDDTINVTICRLRAKLRNVEPERGCLVTVRSVGFFLSLNDSGLIPITSIDRLLNTLN